MSSSSYTESPLGLLDVLGQLWRRKVIVDLVTAAFAAAALAWSLLQSKTYEASAEVSVGQTTAESILGPSINELVQARKAGTEAAVLRSGGFADTVAQVVGHRPLLRANATPQSDVVTVTASASTAEQAQRDAKAAVEEYVRVSRAKAVADLASVSRDITRSVVALDQAATSLKLPRDAAQLATIQRRRAGLLDRAGQIDVAEVTARAGVAQVISEPSLPTAPVAPKPFRNGIAGGLLGAVVASVIALRRVPSATRSVPVRRTVEGTV